jgi:hypothetical protein
VRNPAKCPTFSFLLSPFSLFLVPCSLLLSPSYLEPVLLACASRWGVYDSHVKRTRRPKAHAPDPPGSLAPDPLLLTLIETAALLQQRLEDALKVRI